jgi:DNA-binding CsgD family transcriptional regulator
LHLGLATVARLRNQPVAWIDELRHAIRGFAANGVGVSIAECLNEFAAFAQKVGDGPTAARFLGAAGAIAGPSTSVSISMPNWAPGMHAQLIDDVRADLGEERFGGLVAEGQSWSMTDAIAAALAYAPDAGQPARETLPAPDHGLSPREMEVLRLMADGRSNQQIAGELFISFRTAGNHVTNILGKLGVASRTSAVSYAIRHGIA